MTLLPFTNIFLIDGKSRKIHFKYYLNMKVLKETKGKVYRIITLDLKIFIMQFQQTLNPLKDYI
jgi:hypothetical protein